MQSPDRKQKPARGSTLLLVTILLAVLAVVGVAAVSLGSQERNNAAAKGKRDMMAACASAARMAIWAELAKYGSARLREPMPETEITLSDGTIISAPAPYVDTTSPVTVVSIRNYASPKGATGRDTRDYTNAILDPTKKDGGTAYMFIARCRDRMGRETKVEFSTMLVF